MAETLVLRQSAIVRNASVGVSPPHGPIKTGELPLVQVRMTPGGPQVQSQPAKTVEILPPRDANAAVRTGGLPMVNVKMTQNGPQLDDGQDRPVVIKDNRRGSVNAGGLPMVQVKMTQGGPQVQNVPNVQNAPPQIQSAPTALSQPRLPRVATPATSAQRGTFRVAAPQQQQQTAQVALPPMPEFNAEQLMFLRHAADKTLGEMSQPVVATDATESGEEAPKDAVNADNIQIATSAIETIDQMMVVVAVRAEAAAKAAAAAAAAPAVAAATFAPVGRPSIVPAAPTASYVAGRVGGRPHVGAARVQRNAAMAPRRVSRGGSPLPPVIVKMDNGRSVVQNQEEVAAARAEALAQRTAQVVVPAPEMVAQAEAVSAEVVEGDAQG